ncbi:MAG: DUF192 domain-containing protein [Waterburya sp.]
MINIKTNLGIVLLIFLSSCTPLASSWKNIANASEEIKQGQMLPITATAEMAGETIQLEVAKTPEQQATGLMFRESLADNRGMLFPFENERIARFWMKNVSISLDMIFLNDNRIVGIAADVPPCQADPCPVYGPETSKEQVILVDQVIELRGGRAAELGLKTGDKINIKLLNSQAKM